MVRDSTKSIHGHGELDRYGSVIPPIYVSAIYRFLNDEHATKSDREFVIKYAREENPTLRALERVIAGLEETEDSLAFASGMAAISTAVIKYAKPGTKVVVPIEVYSTTLQLLEELSRKLGFKLVKTWPSAKDIVEAVDRETSMVLFEVMTNPTLKVIDLKYVSESLPSDNAVLMVDNTFTTPVLVKPARFGAELVIHSLTKYMAGHNDVVGGAVAGSQDVIKELWDWRRMLGTLQQPFEAYLTLRGIKTLEVRFERESKSAQAIAEYLLEHSRIEEVMYPGLSTDPYHGIASRLFSRKLYGAVVSFKIKGSKDEVIRFLKKLKIIKPSPSLGGTESLISIASAAAAKYIPEEDRIKLGITDNLLRLSVGLEDTDDLIEDLGQALAQP
ncbi:MAG: cystathionine gamma-synthase family protein [Desulfurococcales archaeon]|nr:cystathionine gamma-synthase family protein [Desulfurococcales archaeon]